VGDGSLSAELWQTVVTLSDEWTKYQRPHARLFHVAAAVGITPEQWQAIKDGQ
jgi:hypothetical protein